MLRREAPRVANRLDASKRIQVMKMPSKQSTSTAARPRKRVARVRPVPVDEASAQAAAAEDPKDAEAIRRIRAMPAEFAWLLIVSGIGGVLLPGPVGTPLLVLGLLMLWPSAFERIEACFEKGFPTLHHHGVTQITRFMEDLERRYPYPK
jgi:hypothetical protein